MSRVEGLPPSSENVGDGLGSRAQGLGLGLKFEGLGLVFKVHRRVYHSTLGSRVIKKKEGLGLKVYPPPPPRAFGTP